MSAHINNTHFTRRQVLIAVLGNAMGMAVWGTLNLGNRLGTGVGTGQARQRLFVNTARGRLLSLGAPAGQDDPRPWTRYMVLTDSMTGNPDAKLEGEALAAIRQYAATKVVAETGTKAVDDQAVSAWLDRLHPMSGCMSLSRQWDEYLTRTSAPARAHLLLEQILNQCELTDPSGDGPRLQLDMQLNSAGRAAWLVRRDDIDVLRTAVARLHLPIEVEVT